MFKSNIIIDKNIDKSQNIMEPKKCDIKRVLYCRVSSLDQSLARQNEDKDKYDLVIEDKVSGAVPFFERVGGSEILKLVESGVKFQIFTSHADRLGRDLQNIAAVMKYCAYHGINIICYKQGLRLLDDEGKEDPIGKLILSILLSCAEMQRSQIRESQAAGIRIARMNPNKFLGRKKGSREDTVKFLTKPNISMALSYLKKGYKAKEAAILSKVHVNTVSKIKRLARL